MVHCCLEKLRVRTISLLCSFSWLHWLLSNKRAKNLFVGTAKFIESKDNMAWYQAMKDSRFATVVQALGIPIWSRPKRRLLEVLVIGLNDRTQILGCGPLRRAFNPNFLG